MSRLIRSPQFTREHRRLIRAGHKTQTRRVMSPQPWLNNVGQWMWKTIAFHPYLDPKLYAGTVPFGAPNGELGDVWALREPLRCSGAGTVVYADDGCPAMPDGESRDWPWERDWLTQMFMPLWAARTFMVVQAVRVERLQAISEADAIAEGVEEVEPGFFRIYRVPGRYYQFDPSTYIGDARTSFMGLWNSINGDTIRGKRLGCEWADNPWVWAYRFRRATSEEVRTLTGPLAQGA